MTDGPRRDTDVRRARKAKPAKRSRITFYYLWFDFVLHQRDAPSEITYVIPAARFQIDTCKFDVLIYERGIDLHFMHVSGFMLLIKNSLNVNIKFVF